MATQTPLTELVASEVRALMGRQDVNKSELARRLETTHTWVSTRVRGEVPIDLNDLQRIADALSVTVADLLPSTIRAGKTTERYPSAPERAPLPTKPATRVLSPRRPPNGRPERGSRDPGRPALLRRPPDRSDLVRTGRR